MVIGLEQFIMCSISDDEHVTHSFQLIPKLMIRMLFSLFDCHFKTIILVVKILIILNVVVSVFVVNILGMFLRIILPNGIKNNISYQLVIMPMDVFLQIVHIIFVVISKPNRKFSLN
jgi:hypothetical protein